jgi:hypothetical protein
MCEILGQLDNTVARRFHSRLIFATGLVILRHPEEVRLAVQDGWLPFAKSQNPSDSQCLRYLIYAVESQDLFYNAPFLAVKDGVNVSTVVREFEITDKVLRQRLENMSINSHAGNAVKAGDSVEDVARRFGITMQGPRTALRLLKEPGLKRR